MEANVILLYNTQKEAEAIAQGVSPDNVKVPQGLHIETMVRGNKVSTKITCKTKFGTFISTIDDLLSAVSIAEKSLSVVKRH